MPPFDDFELSVQDSTPIELYTFVTPTTTYRLCSYHKDVSFGGNTFTAVPKSRSVLQVVDLADDQFDASVELPATHALVQHYSNGVPPYEVACTIQRYQPSSGIALQMWFGYVTALNFRGRMGSFRIPSGLADALQMDCPSVLAQRLCNHVLYDARCTKLRTDFDVITTISAISADGRTITTVASVPAAIGTVPYALHGEILHTSTGERRTITAQPALNQFTIQCEFPNASLAIGHAVTVFAGCDHTVTQCRDKFANVVNFGGHPDMPSSNVFYVGWLASRLGPGGQ